MIINNEIHTKEWIIDQLHATGEKQQLLFQESNQCRRETIGKGVSIRGLIELSNICSKDCYYCGIRRCNRYVDRYQLSIRDIARAAEFAYQQGYGSVVLQAGERNDPAFIKYINEAIDIIKSINGGSLGITLSLGEQTRQTYKEWFERGAHRYLLRIEAASSDRYYQIHPRNGRHSFEERVNCLGMLKELGFQTGSGVMIGLPNQTVEDLADDLLFLKRIDVDMVGMGPYIEHHDTPLYRERHTLLAHPERLSLSLNMIATLRLLMPDINIAATTALQVLDPLGREQALRIGANVMMPNLTPPQIRGDYKLYENKPTLNELSEEFIPNLQEYLTGLDLELLLNQWGDSKHYKTRR